MAGVAINLCERSLLFCFPFCLLHKTNKKVMTRDRDICVTVGLSSEVYLLPTTNEICDFWLFLG